MDGEDFIRVGNEVSTFDEVTISTILNFSGRLVKVELTVVLADVFIWKIKVERTERGIGFREFALDFFTSESAAR